MARCMICGRRFMGEEPPCAHEQPHNSASVSGPLEEPQFTTEIEIPGYRIGRVIGLGGFGIVLAARRASDDMPVAIKLVHRASLMARERLRLEAQALEMIGPPHVPELYLTGTLDDDTPYFVFEHLTLPTLDAKLVEWGAPLATTRFLRLAHAILAALEATHEHGFVHRDLKPENIFLSERPLVVKVIDFGIAKATGEVSEHTAQGMAIGTPEYMSPEQCEGRSDIDLRSDIYAIGVVLYEMLTTRPPFYGPATEVQEAHIAQRPPRPSRIARVEPVFDEVLLRCLAKDPSRRYTSVKGLKRALTRAAEHPRRSHRRVEAADHHRSPAAHSHADAQIIGSPGCSAPRGQTERSRPARRGRRRPGRAGSDVAVALPLSPGQPDLAASPVLHGVAAARAATAPAGSERQYMALLFFEATAGTGKIKRALNSLGGQLIAVEGKRCAAVFGLESSGNPVQRAVDSALALMGQALCVRALIDYDRVRVRRRRDGSLRIFSAATTQKDRFPRPTDQSGLLFTVAAADMLADMRTIDVRAGVVRKAPSDTYMESDSPVLGLDSSPPVGRDEPLNQLLASATTALHESRPTIATVLSEPGHGKSHLCAAVLARLHDLLPTVHVIQLRAREPLGGESNETLRVLLRAVLDLPRQAPPDGGRDLLVSRLGSGLGVEVWPAAALALGWIAPDRPEVRKLSAAPTALRSAATRAAGEALRALCQERKVCLVLDGAHYADDITLDVLEYASLAETMAPLWVCVLADPSFENARPAWARRAARADRIWLPPLSSKSAAELCRHLLRPAENVSQESIDQMVEQTRGSPLLLVELVRGIKRHGLIRQHARGESWYLAHDELEQLVDLPKVEWLAERELATLPPGLAAHARLVAQLSVAFTVAEVEGVLAELEAQGLGDAFPLDAQVGIHRLLSQGLLVTHQDGRFGFRHQLIRDHVAQSTPGVLRQRIHGAAFRYYHDTDAIPDQQRLPRLARHAAQSGLEKTASALYLDLADQAANRHSYVDAELMYSRALGRLDDSDQHSRMRAYNGRGLMRYRLSRYEDALNDLDRARAIARQLGDSGAEVEQILDQATVLDWMQDYRKSTTLVEQAQTLAAGAATPLIEARLCLGLGRAKYRFRKWEESQRLLERAASQAADLGDPGYETLVIALLLIAALCTLVNRQEQAQHTFDRVIALCEERGDKLHLAGALNNRYVLWILRKDVKRAAQDCLRCRQIGRDIGLSQLEYMCAYNLAELYYYAGDLESAETPLGRALEIEPSNSPKPSTMLLKARLLVFAGRLRETTEVTEQIEATQSRARVNGQLDALFIETEELFYHMVRMATRSFSESAWRTLKQRAESIAQPFEIAEVIEIGGLVALRDGHTEIATAMLNEALDVCRTASHLIEVRIQHCLSTLQSRAAP